ncbi:hypothetical protein DACRYDRAFT_18743 [Dacryopinax primogenitus]|uniref:Uncharacterized protein n=1 Tax=Dacryopinax primogenitus (strain DJM 731) TaxID=1858805 RepID=M5FR53_DACPD|nr:uncharacterized protein DACRYDRAFT_18743 [Dacryopinax primogenitus]EJT97354.1 hypothetical protein DACRYDRAFT_18743 [Dacryopinax primogenitus]
MSFHPASQLLAEMQSQAAIICNNPYHNGPAATEPATTMLKDMTKDCVHFAASGAAGGLPEHFGMKLANCIQVGFPALYYPLNSLHRYNIQPPAPQAHYYEKPTDPTWDEMHLIAKHMPLRMIGSHTDGLDSPGMNWHDWGHAFLNIVCKMAFWHNFVLQLCDYLTFQDCVLRHQITWVFTTCTNSGCMGQPQTYSWCLCKMWRDPELLDMFNHFNDLFTKKVAICSCNLVTMHLCSTMLAAEHGTVILTAGLEDLFSSFDILENKEHNHNHDMTNPVDNLATPHLALLNANAHKLAFHFNIDLAKSVMLSDRLATMINDLADVLELTPACHRSLDELVWALLASKHLDYRVPCLVKEFKCMSTDNAWIMAQCMAFDKLVGVADATFACMSSSSLWAACTQANCAKHAHAHSLGQQVICNLQDSIDQAAEEAGISVEKMQAFIIIHQITEEFQAQGTPFNLHLHQDHWQDCLAHLQDDPAGAEAGRQALAAYWAEKPQQVQVNHWGRQADAVATGRALQNEVEAFHACTCRHIVGFAVWGDRFDYQQPHFFGNDMGWAFFKDLLGKNVQDLAVDFEMFATQGMRGLACRASSQKLELKQNVQWLLLAKLHMPAQIAASVARADVC